jgi:4-hydroxy-4-methyl-2-oxoglutarate aldolase
MTFDFESLRNVFYSAVLSDVLDSFGRPNQAMRPFIRPLDDNLVLFGRARTGLYMNTYSVVEGENPYEIEITLVDDLKPGEVAVFGCGGQRLCHAGGSLLDVRTRCSRGYEENQLRRISVPARGH